MPFSSPFWMLTFPKRPVPKFDADRFGIQFCRSRPDEQHPGTGRNPGGRGKELQRHVDHHPDDGLQRFSRPSHRTDDSAVRRSPSLPRTPQARSTSKRASLRRHAIPGAGPYRGNAAAQLPPWRSALPCATVSPAPGPWASGPWSTTTYTATMYSKRSRPTERSSWRTMWLPLS